MKLLIVESPAKARKIQNYLGAGWQVRACLGHVRDLPNSKDVLPDRYKNAAFAKLGVDVENNYAPIYLARKDKAQTIQDLKALAKSAEAVYLAADPDREGESIAWHLSVLLGLGKDAKRVTYQEITERAIRQAVANPRTIDFHLVAAQETRRVLDRLAGYGVSPLLWDAVGGPQSAGRVQSAALMLLSQREQSRLSFVASAFWRVGVTVKSQPTFKAQVTAIRGVALATAASFTPQGQLKPDSNVTQLDQEKAVQLVSYLNRQQAVVSAVTLSPVVRRPPPPLTTSGLQQAANAKLKLGAAQVTKLAQSLYEQGLITYIRTDSPHLSDEAIGLAREAVATRFGPSALPQEGRQYATRNQNAQEAHEAIRPAGKFVAPEQIGLSGDELALYRLVYERTLASQMRDAVGEKTAVTLQAGVVTLHASGVVLTEKGFTALYDDQDSSDEEQALPKVRVGERFSLKDTRAEEKKSSPPSRFTEGKFVQVMEKAGIGRPSTYGATLETLQRRNYVALRNRQLHVTPLGLLVASYLMKQVPQLVNAEFTAQMEGDLDKIANGTLSRVAYLDSIWKGTLAPAIREAQLSAPRYPLPHLDAVLEVRGGVAGLVVSGKGVALPDNVLPEDLTMQMVAALMSGTFKLPKPKTPDAAKRTADQPARRAHGAASSKKRTTAASATKCRKSAGVK
ncbi:type I DNA topoisomerase (plasmid) [Deinococcus psychrotolerans]|uniref:DNA topoisomerase 1 n=1 Tax=Deinococcus psychrotolerans TaxID=2489213 RepID=A0A3G8YJX4_9DEIO|nr:type I DNA topoisomerase [Deinococcus psychrotolerans]AZI45195.1 type I DNA topoisomerase [Deinococcus psychrotolerans]